MEIRYMDAEPMKIISESIRTLAEEEWQLAADPMAGRRARPFPYLSVLLARPLWDEEEQTEKARAEGYNRLLDYQALDQERKVLYADYGENLKSDYRILDHSLIMAALGSA